jgi:excisionase family DNA binding protein
MEEKFVMTSYEKKEFISLIREAFSIELKAILEQKDKQHESEELLNRKEAARFLKISLRTISKYQENGTIPHYRLGRAIYFKKVELIQALGLHAKYQYRNWDKT